MAQLDAEAGDGVRAMDDGDMPAGEVLRPERRPAPGRGGATETMESMSAPAFRALVAERLRTLERDVAEVRTRINGLLFVVASAVVTQLVLRLAA